MVFMDVFMNGSSPILIINNNIKHNICFPIRPVYLVVPQGGILVPILFDIYVNDIRNISDIYTKHHIIY